MLREWQSKEVILPQAVSTKVPPKSLYFLPDCMASHSNRRTETWNNRMTLNCRRRYNNEYQWYQVVRSNTTLLFADVDRQTTCFGLFSIRPSSGLARRTTEEKLTMLQSIYNTCIIYTLKHCKFFLSGPPCQTWGWPYRKKAETCSLSVDIYK